MQDLDRSIISVSKLCCPVCWDTLTYLRTDRDFSVRGRHPILSPVQLPSFLPREILDKMTTRYKTILLDEVTKMMKPDQDLESDPTGIWNDGQSNAGISIDGSDETTSTMTSSWPSFNLPAHNPSSTSSK